MSIEIINMDALKAYGEKSWDLLEWIIENYSDDRTGDFASEYARKLQELHELQKSI